jgi:hypothetical protein
MLHVRHQGNSNKAAQCSVIGQDSQLYLVKPYTKQRQSPSPDSVHEHLGDKHVHVMIHEKLPFTVK